MTSHCDSVAERVALGEPLAELDEHVSSCERCQRLVAMPSALGATKHAVDPGLGFSARMTVGAQHRIVVRRRRRIAAGLAATVAAGTLGLLVLTRQPEVAKLDPAVAARLPQPEQQDTLDEDNAKALIQLADTKKSTRMSAHWARIQRPLKPYKRLVEEGDSQ